MEWAAKQQSPYAVAPFCAGSSGKQFMLILALLLLSVPILFAHRGLGLKVEYEIGRVLVAQNASCDTLSDFELEMIGDYYLETKYPGRYHEMIDSGFGSRTTEEINQFHRDVAYEYYCKYRPASKEKIEFINYTYTGMQLLQLTILLGILYLVYKIVSEVLLEIRRK
ncbi:MAG: hypothetical protein N3H30_01695 [Candidatus Micrarchaeota archaeon]|nr:hypothetical protein [Candidatus Micrarchaeota archaeon]